MYGRSGVREAGGVPEGTATLPGGGRDGDARSRAVRAMLEAGRVAVVGASGRPNSLGARLVAGLESSPSGPELYLVNPRYERVGERPCLPSLEAVPGPVDLVALAVGDAHLDEQLTLAASRGDASAVVFASAFTPGLRQKLAATAEAAGMAMCGAACMGFVNPHSGLRVLGYVEPDPLLSGPVALVTHSGSAYSALLRAERRVGWALAVSSGQELVTTTADYLDYALGSAGAEVLALLVETLRDAGRVRSLLAGAARAGIPTVALAVGASPAGRAMVEAHSGALAGDDATWEALCEATGTIRVRDLSEMVDTLELLCAGRRPRSRADRSSGRLAAVHDSGAERAHLVDWAQRLGIGFSAIGPGTIARLSAALDDGLEPGNPLDVWGTGTDATVTFTESLLALAEDPDTSATVLCVDLVPEVEREDSYEEAVRAAWERTDAPLAVLCNLPSAIDRQAARRLRAAGIPVLEGTVSGLSALSHLLGLEASIRRARTVAEPPDEQRRARWAGRLAAGRPFRAEEGFELLADYGIASPLARAAGDPDGVLAAGEAVGYPLVLKTDEPGVAHKSDVEGVVVGIAEPAALAAAYADLRSRLGPRAVVARLAPGGAELSVGVVRDPLLGPMLVVGAGGVAVEVVGDRRVALPPLDAPTARSLIDRLALRPLLDGFRGRPAADVDAVTAAVLGMSRLAEELGEHLDALEVNPLRCTPAGALALDVLVVPARGSEQQPDERSC